MEALLFQIAPCCSRGHVRWGQTDKRYVNFDAVFFLCLLGFPLIPLRSAHVFRYRRTGFFQYDHEWIPIRWSLKLLFLAWIRRASLVLLISTALVMLLVALDLYVNDGRDNSDSIWFCVAAWIAFPLVWGGCWSIDRKTREMRRVFGDWRWGSSDPMTYRASWIAASDFATPRPNYKAETYTEAVENCLRIHNWWGSLFAARMVERFEDAEKGREYVERIMADPEVRTALEEVAKDESRWHALLGPGRYGG